MNKIVFLTSANSWHVPVKTKYFVSKKYQVYYFKIYPGSSIDITPPGVESIDIKNSFPGVFNRIVQVFQVHYHLKKIKPDILHIISMYKTYFALFASAKKIVFENNGSDVLIRPQKNKLFKYYYSFIYKFCNATVQDSKISQIAGVKYGAPMRYNKVIELGVDFNVFNRKVFKGKVKNQLGLEENRIVFSPRGLTPIYNIDIIIKTIPLVKAIYPNVKYLFCYNNDSLNTKLRNLIESLKVENNVLFTGFLDNETELPYYLKDSDVVLSVPSSDSSPRSVYEAMACNINVIISDLPWYQGKFIENHNISIVPVRNVEALAKKIVDILNTPDLIDRDSAYNYVYENINMRKSAFQLEKLYLEILNHK